MNPYKVFHSACESLRKNLHIVLVRPEQSGNVGSVARAIANMGIKGSLRIVGTTNIINAESRKFAKHARERLDNAMYFETLAEALTIEAEPEAKVLSLAATARVGSPTRPHPLRVDDGVARAIDKLRRSEVDHVFFVFGPESDGLSNEEVDRCDWVVTIPSSDEYRSLNLAQATLLFSYEANLALIKGWETFQSEKPSQKERLVMHFLELAEQVGFILPGDPHKMRPRLETILSVLPSYIKEVKTLHGLLDQAIRTVKKGEVDFKGRYRTLVKRLEEDDGKRPS